MKRKAEKAEEISPGQRIMRGAFASARPHFIFAGVFSFFANALLLASPLYMLQIYDRVLQSGSMTTLGFLTVLLVLALGVMAILDTVRNRLLARAGARVGNHLSSTVLLTMLATRSRAEQDPNVPAAMRDFDSLRNFLSGPGLGAFFDSPWTVIFVIVVALLHPILGLIALVGTLLFVLLVYLNERVVRKPLTEASNANIRMQNNSEAALNSAEAIRSLGMMDELVRIWGQGRARANMMQVRAQDRGSLMNGIIKFLRLLLQGLVLGAGAYLAVQQQITPGAMIAASILTARALHPLEQAVTHWKSFITARQAHSRLIQALDEAPDNTGKQALPKPEGELRVERIYVRPPNNDGYILQAVNFGLFPGEMLGVVGSSGAGKTTLAKALVGLRAPAMGVIRLDGANVADWPSEDLGRHIGYLPQGLGLVSGTVRDNISRFDKSEGADERVLEAARLAHAHDMILRLPKGYDSFISQTGGMASAGQRQRIALARALYGDPSFIVLDEPNSALDQEGEASLVQTLKALKQRKVTTVVMAHRGGIIQLMDRLLVLNEGRVEEFGLRDQVLQYLQDRAKKMRETAQRKEFQPVHGDEGDNQ